MAPKRRIESNGPRVTPTAFHWLLTTTASATTALRASLRLRALPTASHWLLTTAASGTTATARKPAQTRIANGFTLAANDFSQWHQSHCVQAFASNLANGVALAANDRSQWHHSHGAQALPTRQNVSACTRVGAAAFRGDSVD